LLCRWLYALFVAIDANFRLKRRIVSKDVVDPGLSRGWAYFVDDTRYQEHLAAHGKDIQEVRIIYCAIVFAYLTEPPRKAHAPATMQSIWPKQSHRLVWQQLDLAQSTALAIT
jgi:hypothetical protein